MEELTVVSTVLHICISKYEGASYVSRQRINHRCCSYENYQVGKLSYLNCSNTCLFSSVTGNSIRI